MSNQSLEAVAENWYSRLNKLKYRLQSDDLTLEKRQQCEKLICRMILRMMKITPLYVEARMKAMVLNQSTFKPGGITFK